MSHGHRIAIQRLLAAALLAVLLTSRNGLRDAAPLLAHGMSFAGWILIGAGMAGRIWASTYIAGRKNATLVTLGPYSMTRNPLYFASFIAGMGLMLLTQTVALPAVFAVAFLASYARVIRREEAVLMLRHGRAFREYLASTPRFWPDPRLYREPSECRVSVKHLRRALSDSIVWIAAGGLIELLKSMRTLEYLPSLVAIY